MPQFRKEKRIPENADVSIWVRKAPDAEGLEGRTISSRAENISMSGMKLNTGVPIPVGSILDIKVLLKNSQVLYEMVADVVWSDHTDEKNTEQGYVGDVGVTLDIYPNSQMALWNSAIAELH